MINNIKSMFGTIVNKKLFVIICILIAYDAAGQSPPNPTNFSGLAGTNAIELTWNGSSGGTTADGYLALGRNTTGGTFANVVDGTPVPDDLDFTNGNGARNVTHTGNGALHSYTFTGLQPETLYEFRIHPYAGSGASINYRTISNPTILVWTLSPKPGGHAATFTATSVSSSQINLTFSPASSIGNADGYILLRRIGSSPDITGVVNGTDPLSLPLINGTSVAAVITNTATTILNDTGLNGSSTYYYALIPYNYNGTDNGTYHYNVDPTVPTASATTTAASITITQLAGAGANIAASPLGSGSINQAILGFSITADASTTWSNINVQASNPGTVFTNPRLFYSSDGVFGGDSNLGATVNLTASAIEISGLSEAINTTAKNYFLVVDVLASVNNTTPTIQPLFNEAHITVTGIASPASISGLVYSFEDATPPNITYSPIHGAVGISVSTNIIITFNEPVRKVDNSTIAAADLTSLIELKIGSDAGASVTFSASIDPTFQIITIDPTTNLSGNTTYYVELNTVEDENNNPTPASFITFTTEPLPSISSFSTTTRCIGDNLTITGNNFGIAVPTVIINGVASTASDIIANSNTSITVRIPSGITPGNYPVQVQNNTNGLIGTSGSNVTIKAAINLNLNVFASPTNAAVGGATEIHINNSQSGVTYGMILLPATSIGNTQNGDGSTLSFATDASPNGAVYAGPGTYTYKFSATSTGCTSRELTNQAIVTVASLGADAGSSRTVCAGDSVILGGNPTAFGGTTFYNISWNTVPPTSTFSNASNPVVKPTATATYRVSVRDTPGGTPVTSDITITVNQPTSPNRLDIILTPAKPNNTYQREDDPVTLSYTLDGLQGSYTNSTHFEGVAVNDAQKKFFPNAANVGGNQINLLYEDSNGCITKDSAVVFVRDKNLFINGLSEQYCRENATENLLVNSPVVINPVGFNFLGFDLTLIKGFRYTYLNRTRLRDGILASDDTVANPAAFSYTNANLAINTEYLTRGTKQFEIYYQVEILDFSSAPPGYVTASTYNEFVPVSFNVLEKPSLFPRIPNEICENNPPITLTVDPPGGNFRLNGNNTGIIFNPATIGLPNNNTITYTYTDPTTTCSNSLNHIITINRLPGINFNANNGCVGEVIELNPLFNNPSNINFIYSWDSDGEGNYDTTIHMNTPIPLKRIYALPSTYQIKLYVLTDQGCARDITKPLIIGQIPDLAFTWANVCDGDPTRLALKSNFFRNNPTDLDSIIWDFGDGTEAIRKSPSLADSVIFKTYGATNYFNASVTIVTDLNCRKTDAAVLYKVPQTGIVSTTDYFEDFNKINVEDHGWKSGGINSSWEWGVPTGTLINTDATTTAGKAWVTNLSGNYNSNEDSWVHGPCVNLSQIQRPVLSFDFRSLTFERVDGAVLQVNSKNTTNKESDWKTVGAINVGKNWYNRDGIASNPGNQSLLQMGWTGKVDSMTWRTAIIPLDNLLATIPVGERDRVRFRFAFGSADFTPDAEGFAFDNFKIAQRDRVVLLEQFVNSGGDDISTEPNKLANQLINNFISTSTGEVIKIEYHLGLSGPNHDPLYFDNPVDANARAAYYGITSTPSILVDARSGALNAVYAEQTLKTSSVSIDAITTSNNPADKLNIEVTFTAKQNLPANTVVHIAVIEKEINATTALGTNGETSFRYVMKKLLPGPLGTKFEAPITSGSSNTVNVSWTPTKVYDMSQLAIIVFVQNEKSKEIYQAQLLENPTHIPPANIITDAEPTVANQILFYPNPANKTLTVRLPTSLPYTTIKMMDIHGREVCKFELTQNELIRTIDTEGLPSGMYFIKVEAKESTSLRKIIIAH